MKQYLKTTAKAVALIALLAAARPAEAGSIILTGHDTDDHVASSLMNWALTALVNGGNGTVIPAAPTARIGYIGNSSAPLASYLGNYDNYEFYDLNLANWTDAFTDGNDVLVIGSGLDFINNAGVAAMTAQQAAFSTYFNNGGNLFVNTHQGLGNSFYGFLPNVGNTNASNLTTCTQELGNGQCMTPTAAGIASGHSLSQIVQANITHNQFSPAPAFTVLSTYVPTGNAITIGLFQGTIGTGGFQTGSVPEPSSMGLLGLGLAGLVAMRRFAAK